MRNLMIALFIISCASSTKYHKRHKEEGYTDGEMDGIKFTEFQANNYTKIKDAITFAHYRAIQVCLPEKSYFLGFEDHSKIKNIIRTSGNTVNPYFGFGGYSYRRSSSFGIGFGSYSSDSWEEKEIYPKPRVLYICGEQFYAPLGDFKEIESDFYKDSLGAILVVKSYASSPLHKGDIILRISNDRVNKISDLYASFQGMHTQRVEILRGGVRETLRVSAKNVTESVMKFNSLIEKEMCELDKKKCSK